MKLSNERIEEITRLAVNASLAEIDIATGFESKRNSGPCGDNLASKLHYIIETCMLSQYSGEEEE